MGTLTQPTQATPAPNNPPPTGGNAIVALLQQIYNLLLSVFGLGASVPQVLIVTITTNGVFQQISPTPLYVKKAIIQNLSTTDTVTISSTKNAASGAGICLNVAGGTGQGGGSHPVGNIDLSKLFITCSTNAAQNVAVYIEQ